MIQTVTAKPGEPVRIVTPAGVKIISVTSDGKVWETVWFT
jgi:hypothetical protein